MWGGVSDFEKKGGSGKDFGGTGRTKMTKRGGGVRRNMGDQEKGKRPKSRARGGLTLTLC